MNITDARHSYDKLVNQFYDDFADKLIQWNLVPLNQNEEIVYREDFKSYFVSSKEHMIFEEYGLYPVVNRLREFGYTVKHAGEDNISPVFMLVEGSVYKNVMFSFAMSNTTSKQRWTSPGELYTGVLIDTEKENGKFRVKFD